MATQVAAAAAAAAGVQVEVEEEGPPRPLRLAWGSRPGLAGVLDGHLALRRERPIECQLNASRVGPAFT
jgi:hypothetical protein